MMLCTYPCTEQVHKALAATDVLFTGHRAHAVWAPLAENEPAAHGWHAVDVPSMKYWPAEQHTPAPDGVHRVVVCDVQPPEHCTRVLSMIPNE